MTKPTLRTVYAIDLPDGGFLVLDGIRMVRVKAADCAYEVVVVKEDGQPLTVASWFSGIFPRRYIMSRSLTPEEEEQHAASIDCYRQVNQEAHRQAKEWAKELRWVVEEASATVH